MEGVGRSVVGYVSFGLIVGKWGSGNGAVHLLTVPIPTILVYLDHM